MRKTKIVATVGPACKTEKSLGALLKAGVDVIRLNASHTDPKQLAKWIKLVRKTSAKLHKSTALLVDLQGPRVRTGPLKDQKSVRLNKGSVVSIVPSKNAGDGSVITTPVMALPKMVSKGDQILIDNGYIELKVIRKQAKKLTCRVINGGLLGENKGINLPSAPATLPALTAKDKKDLAVALKHKVDYVALSFVRSEKDIFIVKKWMKKRGRELPIIAKIEKPQAVERIRKIVQNCDGIMIARGDLGIEMGVEKIPVVQKALIREANRMRIPVITATQMLESMMEHARPTRAEASDVANAAIDGTDAVMLSGETAIGKHPVAVVKTMAQILREAERFTHTYEIDSTLDKLLQIQEKPIHAITHAAIHAAESLQAKAILVFTLGGKTALLISKYKPDCPIIALSPSYELCRSLSLCRGIQSVKVEYAKNTDQMIKYGEKAILKARLTKKGDPVIIVSGRQALPAARYMTKIHRIGE